MSPRPRVFPHNGKKFSMAFLEKSAEKSFPRAWKIPPESSSFCIFHSSGRLAPAAPAARAQLGPYPIQTKQAAFEASIVKRDKDILWVERKSADGSRSPQVGLAVADIVQIGMPRPALFDAVEKSAPPPPPPTRSSPPPTPRSTSSSSRPRPCATSPASPPTKPWSSRAASTTRRASGANPPASTRTSSPRPPLHRRHQRPDPRRHRLRQGRRPPFRRRIPRRHPLPEEDEEILSALLFALGDAYFALGNYDNALLSYLPLVVFYPYVYDNEAPRPRRRPRLLRQAQGMGTPLPLHPGNPEELPQRPRRQDRRRVPRRSTNRT
jgi:hypothetical protein